jgi:hypothetical protein
MLVICMSLQRPSLVNLVMARLTIVRVIQRPPLTLAPVQKLMRALLASRHRSYLSFCSTQCYQDGLRGRQQQRLQRLVDYSISRCDIKKSIVGDLVFKYFGTNEGT